MASKMGNLKQWQQQEVVTSTDHKNIQAEMSADPIIGHDEVTGDRSDFDIGDPNSGSIGHIVKDIYQRENKRIVLLDDTGAITKIINLTEFEGTMQGILSGKSKTSGFPDFLEAGGGGNQYFNILATATNLELTIDGPIYRLTSDLQKGSLGLAPGTDNECLVNDPYLFAAPVWSKTIGEYGYWITIDTIGLEIFSLDGTIQCFKIYNGSDTEVFIAEIDTTNSRLIPILRGIGGTERIVFSDGDIITLLKTHYIFLDDNLTTIDTTENYPKWQFAEPGTPSTGDYWKKTFGKKWYRYSGADWEALGRVYLGYAICDNIGCLWVEHEDFSLAWNGKSELGITRAISDTQIKLSFPIEISVAGNNISIKNNIILDITSNLEDGVSENNLTYYYVYLKPTGEFVLSDKHPRIYNNKLGWYHPEQYWRMISFFFNDNSLNIAPFIHNPNNDQIEIDNLPGAAIPTSLSILSLNVPPIINSAIFYIRGITFATGTLNIVFSEVSPDSKIIAQDMLTTISAGTVVDIRVLVTFNYLHNTLIAAQHNEDGANIYPRIFCIKF